MTDKHPSTGNPSIDAALRSGAPLSREIEPRSVMLYTHAQLESAVRAAVEAERGAIIAHADEDLKPTCFGSKTYEQIMASETLRGDYGAWEFGVCDVLAYIRSRGASVDLAGAIKEFVEAEDAYKAADGIASMAVWERKRAATQNLRSLVNAAAGTETR